MSKCPKCNGLGFIETLDGDEEPCPDCPLIHGQKKETCTCKEYYERTSKTDDPGFVDPNCPVHKETPNDLRESLKELTNSWQTGVSEKGLDDLEKIAREYTRKKLDRVRTEAIHQWDTELTDQFAGRVAVEKLTKIIEKHLEEFRNE